MVAYIRKEKVCLIRRSVLIMKDSNKNRKFIRSVSAFAFALTFLAGQSSASVSALDVDFFLSDSGRSVSGQTDSHINTNSRGNSVSLGGSASVVPSGYVEKPNANNEEELPDWLYNWIKSENSIPNKTNVSDIKTNTVSAVTTVTALAAFSVMTTNLLARNTPLSVISVMAAALTAQQ